MAFGIWGLGSLGVSVDKKRFIAFLSGLQHDLGRQGVRIEDVYTTWRWP